MKVQEAVRGVEQNQLVLSMPGHHRLLPLESKQVTSYKRVVQQPYDLQEKRTKNRYSKQ
ncbi:hypothetical protein [Pseudomonas fluorescens]|uniref:hypothetical protein n=1 Tax=Pseudomonas fluorescens TaxID=294 RepID=UPI001785CBF6|nr:hypothetical protein [Pseudomonas fluorescens]